MQPVSAPSSVQLLEDADAVLFTLADGSRHVARLIPSARARKLRLRLSLGRGLLLTVPAGMPARALPALLFSFLPWLERHLPACPAPAPPVVPESLLLPLRGTALRVVAAGPLAEGRRQSPSCAEPPLLLRSGGKRLLALVRDAELRLYAAAAPEDAALLLRHWCRHQAARLLPPHLRQLALQEGLTVARVSIRDQRRRWGSCSARDGGSICLNWRAVLLPLPLLDHLCWHELCHLRHMDHSPAYRQTLAGLGTPPPRTGSEGSRQKGGFTSPGQPRIAIPMDGASFFICFAGWTLGGIVNGISGLGAGIFALPIVLLVTDIKTASLITCIICIPLPAILGWQFRRHYRLADLRLLFLGTIPGALLGVALLPRIPARALQMGLGIMLMAHMLWHLLAHRPGPLRSPLLWGAASGAVAGFIQAVSGLGGPPIGMYAQLAHWDKDRTRGNISLYFLGLSLPLVLTQYLAGYYTGPVLQGLIPCLLGCGVGLVISYPLARKIGEASFQRLLAIVIGLSGFSILTRALLDS